MHKYNLRACYYKQRINIAIRALTEREKEEKDFSAEKELIKELQNWPKDLALSIEIKEKILRIFPELSLLEYQRFYHVLRVIEYFHRLVSGNFNYFVNTLSVNEKEGGCDETLNKYIADLEKLHDIYDSLREDEKEVLWLVAILHDIGDIGEHSEHCERGAELIRLLLTHSDYSDGDVNLASSAVKYHIYPGMVAQGERTPRSLINAVESVSQDEGGQNKFCKFLIIFHTMDLAGWRADKNSLTPDSLKMRVGYLDKIRLEALAKNFWKYRLEKLSKEDFYASIKPEYVEKIWQQVDQLILKKELEFFVKHLTETVDLEDFIPIIQSLSKIGQSSTESAKNFVKMFRFFAQFAELCGTDYVLISSNHYPLEKEYEFVLDCINNCLRRVPDKMSKSNLREHLENNSMSNFYGVPIKMDERHKYKLIFDIDLLIEQRECVGGYNRVFQ